MSELALLILGAVLGVFFTVWFQDPIERLSGQAYVRLVRLYRILRPKQTAAFSQPDEFRIGPFRSDFIVVEGNGSEEFKECNVRCFYDAETWELPADLAAIKSRIEREQQEAKERGNDYFWNGKLYGLERFARSRTPDEEDFILNLWFRPSDYFSYLATTMCLDEYVTDDKGNRVTIREKYLVNLDWNMVAPHMGTGFGVAISIVTSDDVLVIAKRGQRGVGPWRGYFNTAINEGLSRVLDMNERTHQPDPYKAVVRGAMEELNIELDRSSIRFLTFGFETRQYQWGLQGYARINLSSDQVREYRTLGARDKWENDDLLYVRFEPKTVIQFLLDNEPWTPFSTVCIIHTLINFFGREAIIRIIEKECRRKASVEHLTSS